ncbi:MAG: cation diffusion facilitator family transporter [Candidatus Hodarchaeales archaeon]|jgi:cation diffusion facilitator family transporter
MGLTQITEESESSEIDEKSFVALTSVLAAIFLTSIKLIIGLMTNSLGIISEAIHSGMDLFAAIITFFAVRKASTPPDEKHHFGHGKIENFSALVETFILALSSVWITYEAIRRIDEGTHVDVNVLAFSVIILSIIIDYSRSRALYKTAKKFNSQALEADALHFSSDIWSSFIVLIGLFLVYLANEYDQPLLRRADPIAAIFVAVIIGIVTFRLGMRTVDVLLDAAPEGMQADLIPLIQQTPGVIHVKRVRTRSSGGLTFVDVIVEIPANKNAFQAHRIASEVEKAILSREDKADIIVHVEPAFEEPDNTLPSQLRTLAGRYPAIRGIHNIHIHRIAGGGIYVDLHAEFPEDMLIEEAHRITNLFEDACREEILDLVEITVHIEDHTTEQLDAKDVTADFPKLIAIAKSCSGEFKAVKDCHHVVIRRLDEDLSMSLHCSVTEEVSVAESHMLAEKLEKRIRSRVTQYLSDIVVHIEPSFHFNQQNDER